MFYTWDFMQKEISVTSKMFYFMVLPVLASMSHAELLEIDFNVVLKIKNQSHVNYRSKSSLIIGIYTVCAYVRPVMATIDALAYLTVGQNRASTYGHRPGQP